MARLTTPENYVNDPWTAWQRIRQIEPSERQALYLLHQEFKHVTMATLEVAVRPVKPAGAAAGFAARAPWTAPIQATA